MPRCAMDWKTSDYSDAAMPGWEQDWDWLLALPSTHPHRSASMGSVGGSVEASVGVSAGEGAVPRAVRNDL